jgi:hypothetical protein
MKKLAALAVATLFAAPDRAAMTAVEKAIDRRVETLFDEPFLLLGNTRGVYLGGTGAVFSTEVGLVLSAAGPFAPRPSKADLDRLRQKRLDRLPVLKNAMQDLLIRSAELLPGLPPEERVVLGTTIFRRSAEDNTGIPAQIVMQAAKRDLLEKNKAAIQIEEF